jgi:phenylalanyl-tRNA synthetase beta chain
MAQGGAVVPVVTVPLSFLQRFIGDAYGAEKLISLFHEIGISVDGVEKAHRFVCAACGETNETPSSDAPLRCDNCLAPFSAGGDTYKRLPPIDMFRLELLANRPDNFDAPGIARSLKGYLGLETGLVAYGAKASPYTVTVDPKLSGQGSYRPAIACAVVKNVSLDDDIVKSIMKLQENLHWALGRNRKFGAIGMYDLAKIGTTVNYRAVSDGEISFIPLACGGSAIDAALSPRQILAQHPKGRDFAHLLEGFERFPLLIDEKGTVLSMPPIINSEQTRVTKQTRGLFVDVTGYSRKTVEQALTIIVTSLKDSMPGCEIGSVTVRYPEAAVVTPSLKPETFTLDFGSCKSLIGVDLSNKETVSCLKRMRFGAHDMGQNCSVTVPCYRTDIRHEHDLIEDVAIAYGYKNMKARNIEAFTIGSILPAERKKQQVREALAGMGFLETISIMLTSEEREFARFGFPVPEGRVVIHNPISTDQTMVRTGLLSGLVEIMAANTSSELPHRVFETGEIAFVNESGEAVEEVAVCAGIVDSRAGFSDIKSVLKSLMFELGAAWSLEPEHLACCLPGRCGAVVVNGQRVGRIGELHPQVLDDFKIPNPAAVLEINLTRMGVIPA